MYQAFNCLRGAPRVGSLSAAFRMLAVMGYFDARLLTRTLLRLLVHTCDRYEARLIATQKISYTMPGCGLDEYVQFAAGDARPFGNEVAVMRHSKQILIGKPETPYEVLLWGTGKTTVDKPDIIRIERCVFLSLKNCAL